MLDIGTGTGLLAIELARLRNRDFEITGVDVSEDMIRMARANALVASVSNRVSFELASAASLPFAAGSFDAVVSNASLHHWADPHTVFSEILRLMRKGGYCLVRDTMRLPPLYGPLISLICRLKRMSGEQHDLWLRAIQASYTTSEVRSLLVASGLKGWKVSVNLMFLDFNIEWANDGSHSESNG